MIAEEGIHSPELWCATDQALCGFDARDARVEEKKFILSKGAGSGSRQLRQSGRVILQLLPDTRDTAFPDTLRYYSLTSDPVR